ncbi:MAG TPA: PqqD family protein [Myxococcales bacterium]|jgi:hypothetical protein
MNQTMRPRRNPLLQAEDLPSGETVVVRPQDGQAVVLNTMGGVVWDLCDGRHAVEDIAAFICSQLRGAALESVTRDVQALTQQLVVAGLVEDVDSCGKQPSTR